MKNIAKILISIGVGLIIVGAILLNLNHKTIPKHTSQIIDTTKYTDVVLVNKSDLDSVQVFLTLQSTQSIVGLFGMDSSNIVTYCGSDSIPCIGSFWVKKGIEYHLNDTNAITGAIITWGVQNQSCGSAQSIVNSNGVKLYPMGINNFEFTVNTWWQNGNLTGQNESFDITCVDGAHSILQQRVTSFGNRDNKTLSPNFGAFWDFGAKDSTGQLLVFNSSKNGTLSESINIPGVFPYQCDWGYKSFSPPTPCTNPTYPVKCSTKWGQINTSQLNRPGQGGRIVCEFLGFIEIL